MVTMFHSNKHYKGDGKRHIATELFVICLHPKPTVPSVVVIEHVMSGTHLLGQYSTDSQ